MTTGTGQGWKPFSPHIGMGRPVAVDKVTVLRSGCIRVSGDIVDRLGKPRKIQLLTNDSRVAFAVCPAATPTGSVSLSRSGQQSEFRINRLFEALGKDAHQITWPLDLPHSWADGLLVIDISEVPDLDMPSVEPPS